MKINKFGFLNIYKVASYNKTRLITKLRKMMLKTQNFNK